MALSGGDTIQLSAVEARALNQFRDQRDWLKRALYDYLRSNPAATQAQAAAHINGLADAYPTHEVAIRDRVALLSTYVTTGGGWVSVKAIVAAHPWWYVAQLAPEMGRPALSAAERTLLEILGSRHGYELAGAADRAYAETRDPARGNLVVEQRWTGTVEGVVRTVRRVIDVALVAGRWVETPGAWEVV